MPRSVRAMRLSVKEAQLASRNEELKHKQLKIDQLTHEMATLKRWQYGRRSEQLDAAQRSLLDESIDADLEAISLEIEALRERPSSAPKSKPRRLALSASFPRRDVPHEPERTQCSCGCSLYGGTRRNRARKRNLFRYPRHRMILRSSQSRFACGVRLQVFAFCDHAHKSPSSTPCAGR
jgi:hypothetical protein